MENDIRPKESKIKKIAKISMKILYQLVMIICVLLILIIVFQKISNNNKSIAGYRIFRVITGSMEPEYAVGEVVISKEVDPEEIKVGDDIVYFGKFGDYNGKIIMHKVTQIDKKENGELNFHAAGLHSASIEDPQISESQIFGVVKFQSGILTVLYQLATSIYSSFIIISILVLNVFVSFKFSGKPIKVEYQEENEEVEEEIEEIEENEDSQEEEISIEKEDDQNNQEKND